MVDSSFTLERDESEMTKAGGWESSVATDRKLREADMRGRCPKSRE